MSYQFTLILEVEGGFHSLDYFDEINEIFKKTDENAIIRQIDLEEENEGENTDEHLVEELAPYAQFALQIKTYADLFIPMLVSWLEVKKAEGSMPQGTTLRLVENTEGKEYYVKTDSEDVAKEFIRAYCKKDT